MDTEAFQHYLSDTSRRAAPLADGFDGAAGGAPCGDLVRLSLEVRDGSIARVSFDAEGCGAAAAAAAAAAELADDADVLDAARIDADAIATELGGLGPQGRHAADLAADALHRALASAAGAVPGLAPPPARGERVLVALSGGVDSAVAALRERERGAEVVAVTLKLWADQRTDATRSCCSPLAVLGARRLAHSLDMAHLTLDLEADFRAQVVDEFIAGYRAGRTPNPCVICNGELRIDAMLDLARRLGCSALATGHYAGSSTTATGPCCAPRPTPPRIRPTCSRGCGPTRWRAYASRSPSSPSPRSASSPRLRGCR